MFRNHRQQGGGLLLTIGLIANGAVVGYISFGSLCSAIVFKILPIQIVAHHVVGMVVVQMSLLQPAILHESSLQSAILHERAILILEFLCRMADCEQ